MKCENCENEHDGLYGSGRFCCCKCARSFSTKKNRTEINKKTSNSLLNRCIDKHVSEESRLKMIDALNRGRKNKIDKFNQNLRKLYDSDWNELVKLHNKKRWKKFILEAQNNKCLICGQNETWNNKHLTLQLDHIDGNNKNNARENLRMICPNCHSQTETFCSKNLKRNLKH